MLSLLKSWPGAIEINGILYDTVQSAISADLQLSGEVNIKLLTNKKNSQNAANPVSSAVSKEEVQITVKQYMTKKASPDFDFMAKWNNDNPMPFRIMRGTVEKETRGMVYMKLHGFAKPTVICSCCGRELTNPVSRYYGVGPICLEKLGIHCEIDDITNIKEELVNVNWEGWIIKSAITEKEVVNE